MCEKTTHPSIDISNSSLYVYSINMHIIQDGKGDAWLSLFLYRSGKDK